MTEIRLTSYLRWEITTERLGDAGTSLDTERLLRIFRENPELVAKLSASVK